MGTRYKQLQADERMTLSSLHEQGWSLRAMARLMGAVPRTLFHDLRHNSNDGISPAMRPGWWTPWEDQRTAMKARARPLAELIARRPQDAQALRDAARAAGADPAALFYLPLTSRKVKEWVVLLDVGMNVVGYAPVDGFD